LRPLENRKWLGIPNAAIGVCYQNSLACWPGRFRRRQLEMLDARRQHPERVGAMARPVVTRLVSPAAPLLVPLLAIRLERSPPLGPGPGTELAGGQGRSRRRYPVVETELHDDARQAAGALVELLGAALARPPLAHAPVVRPERVAELPASLACNLVRGIDVVLQTLARVRVVADDPRLGAEPLRELDRGLVPDADVPRGVDGDAIDRGELADAALKLGDG